MTGWGLLLAIGLATPQQSSLDQLRALALGTDTVALAAEVRRRPADTREFIGRLIGQAGRSTTAAASTLALARRLASTYAAVWQDPFPLDDLQRFERMSVARRAAKVAADSVRLAGNAALGSKGIDAALRLWRDALRRYVAIGDTAGSAAATGNIGAGFYRSSELDSADAYLARARQAAEAIGDRRTALNALGTMGSIALDRGDLRRAHELFSRALEERARIGDVRGMAADHTNLGLISVELGDLAAARVHYGEALGVAREHRLDEAAAKALLNLANAQSADGEYAQAAENYAEALGVARAVGDSGDVAVVLHNLGLLALRRGDYRTAATRLREALDVFTQVGTVEDQVQIRRDLSQVSGARGDMKGALDHLRRAEQLLAGDRDPGALGADLALAQGDLAAQLNTYAEADRLYARAQTMYRSVGNSGGEAEAQQGRAVLLAERKQYARALGLLGAALRTQETNGDRRPAALTRLTMGVVLAQQGNFADARRSLALASDALRALEDSPAEAAAIVALGELELDAGAPLAAEAHFRRAIGLLDGRSAPTVAWQAHAGLGRALRNRGSLDEAAIELRAAIAEVERMARSLTLAERRSTFLADKWDPFAELALVETARGNAAAAFMTSERMRGRQTRELLSRGRIGGTRSADSTLAAREQDLRRRIDVLTRRLESESEGVGGLRGRDLSASRAGVTREALARAQELYAQLLIELGDGAGFASLVGGESSPWRAVANGLARGQALLEYLVTDSTTLIFVVTPDTVQVLDLRISRASLAALVDFARGTLSRPPSPATPNAWRAPLRRLHQHLIAPAEDQGFLTGVRQLIIVPHAELQYLPFAALVRGGDRNTFLVEQYDIGYAPSATVWTRLGDRAPATDTRVLALAPQTKKLPGSVEEVEAIRKLYGRQATVLAGAAATEQKFRAMAPGYGVVHLATYGVLNQHNPLFSFVELGRSGNDDGRLEVHEVLGTALQARLVVLSACQTALASGAVSDVPAGDDWVGLVRAFLTAGADNVIATLWAVEDRSTARVMQRLHRRFQAASDAAVALSQAQRETLRNPETSGPFYWAGFVAVGGRSVRSER